MNRFKDAKIEDLPKDLVDLVKQNVQVKIIKTQFDTENKVNVLNKGLLLYGLTGRGKTHALYAFRKQLIKSGVSCSDVENWVSVLFELKDSFNKGGVRNNISTILSKETVFIDDLGAEKHSEWSQEMIYLIVNESYENFKSLFLSTNLTLEELTAKYGERIVSRLAEMCEFYECVGEDLRTK